jgi:tetratricopeptide (TPR) repeat protein
MHSSTTDMSASKKQEGGHVAHCGDPAAVVIHRVCARGDCEKEGNQRCSRCKQVRVKPAMGSLSGGSIVAHAHVCVLQDSTHSMSCATSTKGVHNSLTFSLPSRGICPQVWYCSAECQKVHWFEKGGGHKKQCKDLHCCTGAAAATGSSKKISSAASRPSPSATGWSENDACIICLESVPPPIQSGCACRGDAGLAHVECRAEDAAHRVASSDVVDGWWKCSTCRQNFTAVMQIGLAEVWWSQVRHFPEDNELRLVSAGTLATALVAQGKLTKAEMIYRKTLAVEQRLLGAEHPSTLATGESLARVINAQGKHAEAETMYRESLSALRRVCGAEYPKTLTTANNMASVLGAQGKHAEAETMYRETLSARRRVLGPHHSETLLTANNLASALDAQGKYVEGEGIFRETLAVQRRVLGAEHPTTLLTANNLANTLNIQGKHAEAEAMFWETLSARRGVLGAEHPTTLRTAYNLANALDAQGKHGAAEPILRNLLAVQQRVLGPHHPDTLMTAECLAV